MAEVRDVKYPEKAIGHLSSTFDSIQLDSNLPLLRKRPSLETQMDLFNLLYY